MSATTPRIEGLAPIGKGIARPEDVVIARDGAVWASDRASAAARILPDGSLVRCGKAGGEPNGLKIDPRDGAIVFANIERGVIQRLDIATGAVRTVLTDVAGTPIVTPNYLIFDARGNLWCSVSTRRGRMPNWLDGTPDGFIFRVTAKGEAAIVADGLRFANGLALDAKDEYLYLAQTAADNVLRFRIVRERGGDTLGPAEIYGPERLGTRVFPDGVAFDADGNLWTSLVLANKIVAITPRGAVLPITEDPAGTLINKPSNIAFGGADMRDVYVGSIAADCVLRGRSSVPGLKLVHQR